jgi:hypothetical protein
LFIDESDEEVEEENNVNNSNHNSYGYRSGKELESVKNFNGNVTHVFENHGLINRPQTKSAPSQIGPESNRPQVKSAPSQNY